jgi:hypothetical protein
VISHPDRTAGRDLGDGHAWLCPSYVEILFSGNHLTPDQILAPCFSDEIGQRALGRQENLGTKNTSHGAMWLALGINAQSA